ncbi:pheST operon leader peptide PheM [Pantoea sp. Ap-870]|nr:pheST operon leader peptide PheM [Pantoea sp. Ap-870]
MLFSVSFFTLAPDRQGLLRIRKETKNRAESLPRGGFFVSGDT